MFDPNSLLESLLKGGLASSSQGRLERGTRGGGIGLDFGRAGGANTQAAQPSPRPTPSSRSAAAPSAAGGPSSSFSGMNMNAGGLALIALIAGTAFKKYREYQAGQAEEAKTAPPAQTAPIPDSYIPQSPAPNQAPASPALAGGDEAHVVIQAMISAAKADGAIDGKEMQAIMGRLEQAGASDEERNFVLSEMAKPIDLNGLIASVKTPKLAAEVYTASIMAINVDTPAEQDYLRRLADGLGLPPQVTQALHDHVGAPQA
ncbi:tellurite resistance TerB family protein [Marinivivus vitaminiproducens]|uniref:tellurite resistance TerB family protein n=1 Tax=Marinivivus vitaminiproducens TaxID=3035935 RepID=UPI00279CA81C|nr:tellurite resistance TerB family protein [Geminicoccaceae bacterium SCSIO 64248]